MQYRLANRPTHSRITPTRAWELAAKANGLEVVYFEKYAIGTLDHSAVLSQIKSLAPQWIFVTGYTNDLLLIRKQMVDQQIK